MSEKTDIAWCDSTASPWYGCSKVSAGCANCYITTTTPLRRVHYQHSQPRIKSKSFAANCRKWNRACDEALTHGGYTVSKGIFPSLCDWLDDGVPIEWLAEMLQVIHQCPNLDFLLPTKRLENFYRVRDALEQMAECSCDFETWIQQWFDGYPPKNVWLGVSCENQEMADKRIPELLKIPSKVRFLSCEPLLGPIDVPGLKYESHFAELLKPIDWVIVGGESGKNARPCNVEWIRSIVQQCKVAGVPVFVKQMGATTVGLGKYPSTAWGWKHSKGGDVNEWPEDLRVREFPR